MTASDPTSPAVDGFGPRGLGVVRVQVAPDVYVSALPMPVVTAVALATRTNKVVEEARGSYALVPFEAVPGFPTWVRARDVITIDVVPTDDPSA